MNDATHAVIEFLSRPELDFGIDPTDAEIALEPAALKDRIGAMLVQPPVWLAESDAQRLRGAAAAADWGQVSDEFRKRLDVIDRFFADGDAAKIPVAEMVADSAD